MNFYGSGLWPRYAGENSTRHTVYYFYIRERYKSWDLVKTRVADTAMMGTSSTTMMDGWMDGWMDG
jgi:hypothetical protein